MQCLRAKFCMEYHQPISVQIRYLSVRICSKYSMIRQIQLFIINYLDPI